MPAGDRSLMESIMSQTQSEEMSAIGILFDTENFKRLKMISEIPPSLMYVITVMGTLQRRYKSKVLKQWLEEFLSMQKSRDRQGIVELVEVLLGVRRLEKGGDE
jgi:hypothetical protein